jgi:hypothetical protein
MLKADPDPIRQRDVAAYIADVSSQLAVMARDVGLTLTESALNLAQQSAEEVLQRNAAPEDAA